MPGRPRIIAGSARGRVLRTPKGDRTRPTSARVREALFSAVTSRMGDLAGAAVLDLFAGSGALGLEALSRGADRALFVDADHGCGRVIRHNIEALGFVTQTQVMVAPVKTALRTLASAADPEADRPRRFDLVLADPPYRHEPEPLLQQLAQSGLLSSDGLLVFEHGRQDELPPRIETLSLLNTRKYGDSFLSFYLLAEG